MLLIHDVLRCVYQISWKPVLLSDIPILQSPLPKPANHFRGHLADLQ